MLVTTRALVLLLDHPPKAGVSARLPLTIETIEQRVSHKRSKTVVPTSYKTSTTGVLPLVEQPLEEQLRVAYARLNKIN